MSLIDRFRYKESRKVELNELFFDLIFVYAIAKIAHTLLHLHEGHVTPEYFFKYSMMTIILWMVWSYQTFYTNRYGKLGRTDIWFQAFGMFVMIYMSNSFYPDFDKTFFPFVLCTALLLLSVGCQYIVHLQRCADELDRRICMIFALTTMTASLISFIALFVPYEWHYIVFFFGIFVGAIGPSPIHRYLVKSPVNFPHLVERYSLLTIIVFGELLVGLASIFNIEHFEMTDIAQFLIVFFLFLMYWTKIDFFVDHHHRTAGIILIYMHLIINYALGMLNAAIIFSANDKVDVFFKINMMYAALCIFFIGVYGSYQYFYKHHRKLQYVFITYGLLLAGYLLSLLTKEINGMFVWITMVILVLIYVFVSKEKHGDAPS